MKLNSKVATILLMLVAFGASAQDAIQVLNIHAAALGVFNAVAALTITVTAFFVCYRLWSGSPKIFDGRDEPEDF